jgi:hypothetical protein
VAQRLGAWVGPCSENRISEFRRRFVFDAKFAEFEFTFSDPMHQLDACGPRSAMEYWMIRSLWAENASAHL